MIQRPLQTVVKTKAQREGHVLVKMGLWCIICDLCQYINIPYVVTLVFTKNTLG